ncbi:MAG: DUF120 domain-containing protein [Desulfurococcaceae archaeon]
MTLNIRGVIVSGTREASRYVEEYGLEFEKLLGVKPYPGTLNIKLDKCLEEIIGGFKPLIIPPPKPGLGVVYAYRGFLRGIRVLVVKPALTRHDCRVLEVVSGVKLREVLGLSDGDVVEIELSE